MTEELRPGDKLVRFGSCVINLSAKWLTRGGIPQRIDPKEFQVLVLLLERPGEWISFQEFKDRVWSDVSISERAAVNTRVSNLRRAVGGREYIENERGKGYRFSETVPIEFEVVASPAVSEITPDSPPQRRSWVRWSIVLASVAILALLATAIPWRHRYPVDLSLDGSTLRAFDNSHRQVWTLRFPGKTSVDLNSWNAPKPLFVDLDEDGRNELLFPFRDLDHPDEPDVLYCISSRGSILWTHRLGRELQTIETKRLYPAHYSLIWIGRLKRVTPTGGLILVGGHRGGSSLFAVELLTKEGKRVGEYYHPGWLWGMTTADLDADGFDGILLGGVNNAFGAVRALKHGVALIVLDSRRVVGQGPVPAGDDRVMGGLVSGAEKAVILFPDLPDVAATPSAFSLIRGIAVVPGLIELVVSSSAERGPSADYKLNYQLRLDSVEPSASLRDQLAKNFPKASQREMLSVYRQLLGELVVIKNDLAGSVR